MGSSAIRGKTAASPVPKWASIRAKTTAGIFGAVGALLVVFASIPPIIDVLNDFSKIGWFAFAVRGAAAIMAFVGTLWVLVANLKEKDEIEKLRDALKIAEASGLSHAATAFRISIKSIATFNASGWTPETVRRFQPEALRFGKSLFDYLGIRDVRVCLYEPGAVDMEPEAAASATISTLNLVSATEVPGRHNPSAAITRSSETSHMFQALYDNKPRYQPNRKLSKSDMEATNRWKSSICLGINAAGEPFALLTVDSTNKRAFNNISEGVLVLLGDLLTFAEGEKDRARQAQIRQMEPVALESGHGR